MRSKKDPNQLSIEEFEVPFWGALEKNNRWIYLANSLPWGKFTEIYNATLSENVGREALPARIAIGSLIIKHLLGLTVVRQALSSMNAEGHCCWMPR